MEIKEINWSSNSEDTFSFPYTLDYIIASGTDRRMWILVIMPLTVVYFVVLANACVLTTSVCSWRSWFRCMWAFITRLEHVIDCVSVDFASNGSPTYCLGMLRLSWVIRPTNISTLVSNHVTTKNKYIRQLNQISEYHISSNRRPLCLVAPLK